MFDRAVLQNDLNLVLNEIAADEVTNSSSIARIMFMRFLFRVGLECMLKDEQIELFAVLRSCVFSPMGLNILAQGKAKRRPGCRPNLAPIALKGPNNLAIGDATTLLGPFRATFRRFVVPRAAIRDVPSLRSALG